MNTGVGFGAEGFEKLAPNPSTCGMLYYLPQITLHAPDLALRPAFKH